MAISWRISCAPIGDVCSPFDFTQGRLWHPDSLLTRQMRAKVSWIQHLTRSSTRLSNRLRALLLRFFPAALRVFPDLSTKIALEFIRAYPTP
jgi:hypothetical protein